MRKNRQKRRKEKGPWVERECGSGGGPIELKSSPDETVRNSSGLVIGKIASKITEGGQLPNSYTV